MQFVLVILIIGIIVIVWITTSISEAATKAASDRKNKQELQQKWSHRKVDQDKNLLERNEDIIDKHLSKITLRQGHRRDYYYIDNAVRDCIQDIAEAEGNPKLGPGSQYLSRWTPSTASYKQLSTYLVNRFNKQKNDLGRVETEKKQEKDKEQRAVATETKRINEKRDILENRKKKHKSPSSLKDVLKTKDHKALNISIIEKILKPNSYTWDRALQELVTKKYEPNKLSSIQETKYLTDAAENINTEINSFNTNLDKEKDEFTQAVNFFKTIKKGYTDAEKESTEKWLDYSVDNIQLPKGLPKFWNVGFEEENKIAVVEVLLPDVVHTPISKTVQLKSGPTEKPLNQKETRELVPNIHPAIMLRIAYEIMVSDVEDVIELLVVNGIVEYDDPTTGNKTTTNTASFAVKKDQVVDLNLEKIDPLAAFVNLKGKSAGKIIDIIPVIPVLTLDRNDSRIMDTKEVIDDLGSDTNLAAMDWQDFENLIAELFQKEFADKGAEVKVTQSSRDRGVDALVYDPDPITGGKYVIQAKRYAHTVGVSAVRDLVAVVQKEGASKGILVTTSNYGPDAYQFAKGSPITLITGPELLGLLQKHGYDFRINLAEARKIHKEQNL